MEPFELYVLCRSRSAIVGLEFLDAFIPNRKAVAAEFPYPEFGSDPLYVYQTPEEVMRRLEVERHESYSIYWDNNDNGVAFQGILFYTLDDGMIVGLVLSGIDYAKALLDVANVVGGRFGFITSENRPPDTKNEFIDLCCKSTLPSLVDGLIQ